MSHPQRIAALDAGGNLGAWERLGFAREPSGLRVGGVLLRVLEDLPPGLHAWTLAGVGRGLEEIDGIPSSTVPDVPPARAGKHPNGAVRLDHVVVTTPSLDRTAAVLDDLGIPLRRERRGGTAERPLRQGFFRLGEVVLEVVEAPGQDPAAPARLWGLVAVVPDLDGLAAALGPEVLPAPKDAVQPGRRIAAVRSAAGLGVPMAFITPEPVPR